MEVDLDGLFHHNNTFDYDDYVYVDDQRPGKSKAVVVIPFLYSVVLVLGLLVNGILLVVLALKRQSWRMSDTFILHLGLADVLLLLTLPLWASQAALQCGCCFRGITCGISWAVFNMSFYCGNFLLVCLTLDRYLSIVRAIQLFSHKNPWVAHCSCAFMWLISLLLSIPDWASAVSKKQGHTEDKAACVPNFDLSKWQLASRLIHLVLSFPLPITVLIVFYYILRQLQISKKGFKKQRAVVVILVLVVVSFLSWLPYNITLSIDTFMNPSGVSQKTSSANPGGSLKVTLMVTSALCCVHATIRPLIYMGLCGNFRKRTLALLRCRNVDFKGSLWELGVGDKTEPGHEGEEVKQMTSVEHQVQSSQC